MPDHLHLIVEGSREDADLRRFVKIAKQRVVYSLREDHGVRGVWQEGFHDWILRPEQSNRRSDPLCSRESSASWPGQASL
jgi:REP element-mobilizing transposase RayT